MVASSWSSTMRQQRSKKCDLPKAISSTLPIFAVVVLSSLVQSIASLAVNSAVNKAVGKVGKVTAGPIEISSLGCGTWSW